MELQAPAPTSPSERIFALDTIRGVAVLGILLMNVLGMGLPDAAYSGPSALAGGDSGWNLRVWIVESFYFEGTMRGLFTLLFGAGVVLYTSRLERGGLGIKVADLYYRRNLWLVVFGLVNAHLLLWRGDVLYFYGMSALFLFVFRDLPVRKLLLWSLFFLSFQTINGAREYVGYRADEFEAGLLLEQEKSGTTLSTEQQEKVEHFLEANKGPDPNDIQQQVGKMRADYATTAAYNHNRAFRFETQFFARVGLWECLGMMLLGMALFKSGALTLGWSTRAYVAMLIAGYGIGLTVNALEIRNALQSDFSPSAMLMQWTLTYDLGRIPTTLGHVALAMLVVRSGLMRRVLGWLAATGRMALTNYLIQSVFALLLFTGTGLGWYNQLQRYELYYVVLAIWALELAWSPWWLNRYRFGPVEWLWRTLTRWERQPFRKA